MIHVVLFEPEIPSNTGNISRTCAVAGCHLHLIRPLGFSIGDRYLKRAGLDYWDKLTLSLHDGFDDFLAKMADARLFYFTTHGKRHYDSVAYKDGDALVFGPETRGLPPEILENRRGEAVRIPMGKEIRSLNLSNAVAIGVYEALRQMDFPDLF